MILFSLHCTNADGDVFVRSVKAACPQHAREWFAREYKGSGCIIDKVKVVRSCSVETTDSAATYDAPR